MPLSQSTTCVISRLWRLPGNIKQGGKDDAGFKFDNIGVTGGDGIDIPPIGDNGVIGAVIDLVIAKAERVDSPVSSVTSSSSFDVADNTDDEMSLLVVDVPVSKEL
ncbi:hypothetical protein HDU76_001845 [Blyttiomyces sp. JEL0837]|nr:hypothetical protein HDU76_001845 [Blyttiomyces sp. JEL0837]